MPELTTKLQEVDEGRAREYEAWYHTISSFQNLCLCKPSTRKIVVGPDIMLIYLVFCRRRCKAYAGSGSGRDRSYAKTYKAPK